MTTTTNERFLPAVITLMKSQDASMAIAILAIIVMMVIPLPPFLLDLLMAVNLALSLGFILISMYVKQPTDFASFPTALLLVTLLRLGINVATSRSILLNGQSGKVVTAFGNLVMGGNYVVGFVVFLILMVIQWVVINSGAGRVAEVGARFTLDALPGKQLSIDADLNAGIIDEQEAKKRRKDIQKEADFYGAMDGASKFVKGDAIAAIIIILVNIVGGFIIGMVQGGFSLMEALQNYSLQTVGAGLAVQIPALLISASAGLIVTRSTSDESLGNDLFGQVANFNVLMVAGIIIAMVALAPGIPKFPFIIVGGGLMGGAFLVWKEDQKPVATMEEQALPMETRPETPADMMKMVVVDPLELEVGYGLIPLIDEGADDNLLRRITGIRRQVMKELGIVLPIVRVRDNLQLQPQYYRIKIRGEEVTQGELRVGSHLAIPGSQTTEGGIKGTPTTEPAFGLPAYWISNVEKGRAELMGYTVVNPISVMTTHLTEVVRTHAKDLLSRQMVSDMIDQIRASQPAAVDGLVPDLLGIGEVQQVLQNLLKERIPIRDLSNILEVLAGLAPYTQDAKILAEAVRQKMARTISNLYKDFDGAIHVFTLAPQIEETLKKALVSENNGLNLQIDAQYAQTLITATGLQMEKLARENHIPILLTPRELRLPLRELMEHSLPKLIVMAFSEVSRDAKVMAHGVVELQPTKVLK